MPDPWQTIAHSYAHTWQARHNCSGSGLLSEQTTTIRSNRQGRCLDKQSNREPGYELPPAPSDATRPSRATSKADWRRPNPAGADKPPAA
jgi:hypothetical protein